MKVYNAELKFWEKQGFTFRTLGNESTPDVIKIFYKESDLELVSINTQDNAYVKDLEQAIAYLKQMELISYQTHNDEVRYLLSENIYEAFEMLNHIYAIHPSEIKSVTTCFKISDLEPAINVEEMLHESKRGLEKYPHLYILENLIINNMHAEYQNELMKSIKKKLYSFDIAAFKKECREENLIYHFLNTLTTDEKEYLTAFLNEDLDYFESELREYSYESKHFHYAKYHLEKYKILLQQIKDVLDAIPF